MFLQRLLLVWLALAGSSAPAASALSPDRVAALFRPFLADRITLSPDGRYLAYTEQRGHELLVIVRDLSRPGVKTTLSVDEDRLLLHSKEKEPAQLRFLRWATPTRLVFAPTVHVVGPAVQPPAPAPPYEPKVFAPIMAVDADGRNARTLVDAPDFEAPLPSGADYVRTVQRAPEIIGFAPGDRDHLLLHVPGLRPGAGIAHEAFKLNVHTGKLTSLESDLTPGRHHYDRHGRARLIVEGGTPRAPAQTFLYRAAGSSRWRRLHELAGKEGLDRFQVSPEIYFEERAIPLGFAYDANILIFASNAGRDTFGLHGLDLTTWRRTTPRIEHPGRDLAPLGPPLPGDALVFDEWRQTLAGVRAQGAPPLTTWLDAEISAVQRDLDGRFPRRDVALLEWDQERTHFLFRITGGTEPGRYFVFQRRENLMVEIFRRAPWLRTADLHDTRAIEFAGPGGAPLSGYLTLPRRPRLKPPPLVIKFAAGLPAQPHAPFDREAHVLADLGLAVLRLNQRGVAGFGARHRDAIRGGIDRVATDDALAAIRWIAQQHPIDARRVVALGEGFAGYLAVRATQLAPGEFRCAVATEPPLDLDAWLNPPADYNAGPPSLRQQVERAFLERAGMNVRALSVFASADALTRPVFVFYRPERADAIAQGVARLRAQLKRRDVPHQTLEVADDYMLGLPAARTRAYRELEEFLNLNLYHFGVKIGPTKVVP